MDLFVTPDLIGGPCLRWPWIPAFAGISRPGAPDQAGM